MGTDENLIGPEGAPLSYVVQPEESSDQNLATVVFRSSADGVNPSGVIKGYCSDQDRADGVARYDLPQSTYTDFWTYRGR